MQYESERIEYKSQMIDDIYKEVIAFANTDGGVIYLGIDDKGNLIGIDASLIARQVPAPQGKQINFSVAILACKQFLKGKIRSAQIFEILSMHLSPIRPGRQYKRYQNPVSAVAFQYRLS